jgi:hypothetical protein
VGAKKLSIVSSVPSEQFPISGAQIPETMATRANPDSVGALLGTCHRKAAPSHRLTLRQDANFRMAAASFHPEEAGVRRPYPLADRVDQGAFLACGAMNLTGPVSGD